MNCCDRIKISSVLIFCSADREGSGRINLPVFRCWEFNIFKCTSQQPSHIIDAQSKWSFMWALQIFFWSRCWYVAIEKREEEKSKKKQGWKKKQLLFFACFCICVQSGVAIEICCQKWELRRRCSCSYIFNILIIQWQFQQLWEPVLLSCSNYHWLRFTGLMSMWLRVAPHWSMVKTKLLCFFSSVFVCEVLRHPQAYGILQSLMVYVAVNHYYSCRRVQVPRFTLVVHHI